MIDTHDYRVELVGTSDKTGLLTASDDGLPEMVVASPPEFGGPVGTWSPEHLFVASVATCLMTTFRSIAEHSGLDVVEYRGNAIGHLRRSEDGLYEIAEVTLRPEVTVSSDRLVARAQRLLEKAERACLISRSIKAKVTMEPRVLQAHQVGT